MIEEGLKPHTVNGYLNRLTLVLNAAVDAGYLEQNPMKRRSGSGRVPILRSLETDRGEAWLSLPQLEQLAAAFDERYRALILLTGRTGLRFGEAGRAARRSRRGPVGRGQGGPRRSGSRRRALRPRPRRAAGVEQRRPRRGVGGRRATTGGVHLHDHRREDHRHRPRHRPGAARRTRRGVRRRPNLDDYSIQAGRALAGRCSF